MTATRRSPWGWFAHLGAATFLLAALSGCAVDGLTFVKDDRVRIQHPGDGDSVTLPFDLTWTVTDFDGSFAVFFDRPPMRPGRDLLSLVDDTDPCRALPGCPTTSWLNERDIYITDGLSTRVERLRDNSRSDHAKDRHLASIVLLDDQGRRVGESVYIVEFFVEREDR